MLWDQVVELLRALIFGVAHVCNGSLGAAVLLVSLAMRLALLPLTLRLARRALRHRQRLADLQPEVERLRRRYASDPAGQWREVAAFYRRRGVRQVDPAGLLGGLAQLPVLGALFATLRKGMGVGARFLWVRNLAMPDLTITLVVTALTVAGVALAPSADPTRRASSLPLLVTAVGTFWFLSSTSALFAVASAGGSLVNLLQGFLLRRAGRGANALPA